MSKRKKKNSKSNFKHPIKPFLRVAGMYGDPYKGLYKAVKASESKDFYLILDELKYNKTYNKAVYRTPFPKIEDLTKDSRRIGEFDKPKQFIWTACLCAKYSNEISTYISLKEKYETAYLLGSFSKAKKILDEIEDKFNYSLWLINSRFQLLQHESLQSQKDFLEKIVSVDNISPIVAFFSNYFSLRNEDNTSYDVYLNEIQSIIDVEAIASYAIYQLLPSNRENIDNTSSVLAIEEENSIIDRYEALINMLHIESCRVEIDTDYKMLVNTLRALDGIKDKRLDKLNYIFREGKYEFQSSIVELFDEYTKGNYDIEFPLDVNNIEIIARQYLFFGDVVIDRIPSNSIYLEIVIEVANILSKSGDLISSRKKLEKISLLISKHPVVDFIHSFLSRESEYLLLDDRTFSDHYFALTLDFENPWIIPTIEHLSKFNNYEKILRENFPNSITYELHSLMVGNFHENSSSIKQLEIPSYRKSLYLGFSAYKSGLYQIALKYFSAIETKVFKFVEAQAREYKVKAYIADNELLKSVDIIIKHCLVNNSSAFHYPIIDLLQRIEEDDKLKVEASQKTSYCILLSIASRMFHPKWERSLSDAFENILDNYDVEQPSELFDLVSSLEVNQVIYIMRYVAIPRILDDLTIFDELDEVEAERIQICQKLLQVDKCNSKFYSNEIRNITKEAKVTNLVNHLDTSKIYVNEAGILSHIEDSLTRSFKKFKALLELPELNIQVDKISEKLKALMINAELGSFTLPSSERISLFDSIYESFIIEMASNQAFGLDTYISTNIRHGAFEGQIRRSFDRHELLVNKHKGSIRQRIPERWSTFLADYDENQVKLIFNRMERFTERTVKIIDEYLQYKLQIQTDEMPTGLFCLNSKEGELEVLRSLVTKDTNYDDFLQILLNKFWSLIDVSMSKTQDELRNDLKSRIISALDIMYNGILSDLKISDFGSFGDAVVQSKTEFESNINDLCEWFTRTKTKTIDEFDLELATEVALKQVKNCYVSSFIECNKEIGYSEKLNGRYFANMVEILFIIFQNIVRHGRQENPNIDIEIKHTDGIIEIKVHNFLSDDEDIEALSETIKELNELYKCADVMERANTEGGSGLSKIWRILEHELEVSHSLQLSLLEQNQFFVLLKIQSGTIKYDN